MIERNEAYRHYGDSCCGVYPEDEFEGVWVEHWPNGQLKFRGSYKKHQMRVGQHMCFYPNGVLQEVSYWNDGYAVGTVLWFREDGTKEQESSFGQCGGKTRTWTQCHFDSSGRVWWMTFWKDDALVAEWTEPELRKIEKEIDVDGIVSEAVRLVYPDKTNTER